MRSINRPKIIGIIGGMGPLAGVLLQKYIINETAAEKDQDHLPVIVYTNPQIPDRSASLSRGDGDDFVVEILKTVRVLEKAGATVIALPCNTAHARFETIQSMIKLPIVNMVDEVIKQIAPQGSRVSVGLLATQGTIDSRVYQRLAPHINWIQPSSKDQTKVMELIYTIKSGQAPHLNELITICKNFLTQGATNIVLGCTELSLIQDALQKRKITSIDSLRVLARKLVAFNSSFVTKIKPLNREIPQCVT